MWSKSVGSSGGDQGEEIAVDDSEYVFVSGFFEGTVDFDPGSGTSLGTSEGDQDIYVLKLQPPCDIIVEISSAGHVSSGGNSDGTLEVQNLTRCCSFYLHLVKRK